MGVISTRGRLKGDPSISFSSSLSNSNRSLTGITISLDLTGVVLTGDQAIRSIPSIALTFTTISALGAAIQALSTTLTIQSEFTVETSGITLFRVPFSAETFTESISLDRKS